MSAIITKFSKEDIVEMSGVMSEMNAEMNNIKSVDGLIDEIKKFGGDDIIRVSDVIKIIKEYCEECRKTCEHSSCDDELDDLEDNDEELGGD